MDFDLLKRILEAALLAAPQPLTVAQLTDLFGEGEAPPADDLRRALLALQEDSASRGVELVEVASGFRYQVRAEIYPHISRLWAEKPARYSRALLETLALIAYRQPITRGEIEAIRGVAVNSQIIRTLEEREWIRVVGHRDVPGKPALFGTTRAFLDYFNLKSLDQLPPLSDLQELPDIEPELDFDGARAKAALPAIAGAAGDAAEGQDADGTDTAAAATEPNADADADVQTAAHTDDGAAADDVDTHASAAGLIAADAEPSAGNDEAAPALADPDSIDGAQHADAYENDLDTATRLDEQRVAADTADTTDPTGESETSPEQIP
ncbi:SMC-Scp complex subunit ScpB [Aquimonas voraii]|uniref:Condensin subunit ScpB n=1 Tax=Aquimonas voraii TaxID=265719 RepID=A0A1G6SR64_9GAMM|nr:SMC-Scp complex subunit ScpB [Aquimonas voraii]SDD19323.1 condensin subunit ScpB [Aquimonas voraii]